MYLFVFGFAFLAFLLFGEDCNRVAIVGGYDHAVEFGKLIELGLWDWCNAFGLIESNFESPNPVSVALEEIRPEFKSAFGFIRNSGFDAIWQEYDASDRKDGVFFVVIDDLAPIVDGWAFDIDFGFAA